MSNDNTFATILTGMNCHAQRDGLDAAVANRFNEIKGSEAMAERDSRDPRAPFGYCYDGNRTLPSELGWRFRQDHGSLDPVSIEAGVHDDEIAHTFHNAADSEYYYRYEKDWG
jgi:hypothetical protein